MKISQTTLPLTQPDPLLGAQIRHTVRGMAHFAGSGPLDAVCGQCTHFGGKRPRRDRVDGEFKKHLCRAYTFVSGGQRATTGIPPRTPACRYFEPRVPDLPLVGRVRKAAP